MRFYLLVVIASVDLLEAGSSGNEYTDLLDRQMVEYQSRQSAADPNATHPRSLSVSGFTHYTVNGFPGTRNFHVYIPPSVVNQQQTMSGIVLFFHGYGQNVQELCGKPSETWFDNTFNVEENANNAGFVAVCLEGLGGSQRGWNSDPCCGNHGGADDVGFTRAVLTNLKESILPGAGLQYPEKQAGRANVFAFGFSTGGLFSYRLACDLSDEIFGIAVVGATFDWAFGSNDVMNWAKNCKSTIGATSGGSPVPVWSGIGTKDTFTTGEIAQSKWREYSETILDCPQGGGTSGVEVVSSVTCYEYKSCSGSSVAKPSKWCLYNGMRHKVLPMKTSYGYESTAKAWEFLSSLAIDIETTSALTSLATNTETISSSTTMGDSVTTQIQGQGATTLPRVESSLANSAPLVRMSLTMLFFWKLFA